MLFFHRLLFSIHMNVSFPIILPSTTNNLFVFSQVKSNIMKQLTIQSENLKVLARLNESPTAKAIWDILPVSGPASVWGDEIYFSIPVKHSEADDAVAEVEVGTLAYWPPGSAFCIFWGPTPVSTSGKPKAYSPVNILGDIIGDATLFDAIKPGQIVTVSAN